MEKQVGLVGLCRTHRQVCGNLLSGQGIFRKEKSNKGKKREEIYMAYLVAAIISIACLVLAF